MTRSVLAPLGVLGRGLCVGAGIAGLGFLISPAAAWGQANLAPNPSFELGAGPVPSNWALCANSGAATVSVVTSPFDQGTRSLKVALTQDGDVGVCSDPIAVSPGVTFRLAARSDVNVAPVTNKQAQLQILELSSANVQLSSRVVATTVGRTNGWESLAGFFTTGPSTAQVKIRLLHNVPGSTGASFYWDSVSLAPNTAVAWERWERELTSAADYTVGTSSNPYRDVQLTATFYRNPSSTAACPAPPAVASCSLPDCFQQAGFWDGLPGSSSAKTFRVRTTLPAGTWCWNTTCATQPPVGLTVTTANCKNDLGLTKDGAITVTSYTGANKLYRLGLPVPKANGSFLVYGDGTTTFPWIADTVWSTPFKFSLPTLGSPPSSDLWKNYVADRAGKNFTVLLVAPATQYINSPPSQPTPPSSGYVGFLAQAGCTPTNYAVVPNNCSYLDPAYWRKLDSMIKDANDAGLEVMVAGLVDPTDRGGPGTFITPLQKYPRLNTVAPFARQLAARLAGSFVFFSPGFDDKRAELLDDNVTTVQSSMVAVGQALRGPGGAAPRHLVGNQLAGGSAFADYDFFHAMGWLSFEFYQSGHKNNTSAPCTYGSPQEYARSICRARELSLHYRCQGAASTVQACPSLPPPGLAKPAVNSEGAYEDFSIAFEDPDNREGERSTAYVSALSGSFGYTIGILGIRDWSNPGLYSDNYVNNQSKADNDLQRLAGLFKGAPWTDLEPRHNLIANNPPVDTATTPPATGQPADNEKRRMVLAGNSSYALAYVPGVTRSSSGVQIKTTGVTNALPGLDCGKCWNKLWVDPSGLLRNVDGTCAPGSGFVTINTPNQCAPNVNSCDWVLQLTKGKPADCNPSSFANLAGSGQNDMEAWMELSFDSTTSAILAQLIGPDGLPSAAPIVVSPDGASFQKLPMLANDSRGNFFVTWEAEDPATGLDEIFARRYDNNGDPLGDVVMVSQPSAGQQAEPSVTADSNDNFVVSWTRYTLEDAPSSVELQIFDTTGAPSGDTIGLPPDPGGGVATMSLVQSDAQANLWVAWTVEDRRNGGGDVYAQRLLTGGVLSGLPIRINSNHAGVRRLTALQVQRDGGFRVVWEGLGASGRGRGFRERRYDAQGHPAEGETLVSSGD
jgi:hypothetical protein